MANDPELIARYSAIVMQLPPLVREVFLLHCIDELEFCEIASRLAVSVRTVERALVEALVQIDRELKQGDNRD